VSGLNSAEQITLEYSCMSDEIIARLSESRLETDPDPANKSQITPSGGDRLLMVVSIKSSIRSLLPK
jgi:hypothetical protein